MKWSDISPTYVHVSDQLKQLASTRLLVGKKHSRSLHQTATNIVIIADIFQKQR